MGVISRWPNVFKRLEIAPGGSLIGWGGISGSQTYYVNTASATYPGNDSNDGLSYKTPLLTITAALAKCVDGQNDVIYIIDYWRPSGETWPILVNKKQVHIAGIAQYGLPYPAIHPATDVDAFQLGSSGQYGSISYLTIGGGSSCAGIEMGASGQVDGFHIHHNTFGHSWFGTPLNAIRQAVGDSRGGYGNVIEDNLILGDLANCQGAITGNGFDFLSTTLPWFEMTIRRNRFLGVAVGITCTHHHTSEITDNKFICADAGDGEAIALLAASQGNMVDGNVAMNGGDAVMTQQPYVDVAATNKNHWGVNWTSNAVDLPKQSA